jgi:hypothetical protein
LPYEIRISALLGKSVVANRIVPKCEIQVRKEVMEADLIVMTIEDYDLILGVDWLSNTALELTVETKWYSSLGPIET